MEYFNLGEFHWPISTGSSEAQCWFDRAMTWCYGFHHEEALACFERAIAHDPECAMAWWGIAYAVGPNYNKPWCWFDADDKQRSLERANSALARAVSLAPAATPREQALIGALRDRYPSGAAPEDMTPFDDAYAAAMRGIQKRFGADLNVRSLCIEALMNRTPWQMWDLGNGVPAPGADTIEAQALFDAAFAHDPAAHVHAGLLHLYIHLMEMSPHPERALPAAERLRTLVPDAGHLVHMATHIDILCGRYQDVVRWNERAIAADAKYFSRTSAQNFYTIYRVHNYHFAAYGATFLGQLSTAMRAVEGLAAAIPESLLRVASPPMADYLEAYLSVRQHVLIRFGRWQEIVTQTVPADAKLYCVTTAMIHYAQGVAYAAMGDVAASERSQDAFLRACERVPESRRLHNNTCRDLLLIAREMLAGELQYRRGNHDAAFAHLRHSVALDDALPYDEPWGWMQPARHALGALLLEQERVQEAEAVYRADLGLDTTLSRACQHPDNLWSLHGLDECLARRGADRERALVAQRLALARALADVPVTASCFCRLSSCDRKAGAVIGD